MRLPLALCALPIVLFAACGGSGDDDAAVDSPTTAPEATSGDGGNNDAEDPTTPAETNGGNDNGDASSAGDLEENTAVVTVGGETFRFALSENGDCDADFFGGFRAFLRRVDSDGEFVQTADGFFEGMTISMAGDMTGGPESGLIALSTDPAWVADPSTTEGTGLDAYTIDGGVANGSATFVNAAGETAERTFTVRCAE